MFNPVPIVQATFAVFWIAVGVAGAWLGVPWSEVDRSTLFVFFALVSMGGAATGWTGSTVQKVVGTTGALMGLAGVVSYFLQTRGVTIALFVALTITGVVALVLALRTSDRRVP